MARYLRICTAVSSIRVRERQARREDTDRSKAPSPSKTCACFPSAFSIRRRGARSSPASAVELADEFLDLADEVAVADEERRPLVERVRDEVEDGPAAVRRVPPGLLRDEGERRGLVEEPQLARRGFGVLRIGRIVENAAGEEVAVEVRDERPDV